MGKHETPILRMIIQGDRLVPTAAWEAERLASYRTGSVVNVVITQQKNRKLERKYWAILSRVVKDCPVKWREAEDAHRAIRLALGVVEPFVTAGGKMHAEVKSTASMDDPEYQRYFEDAMALLHRITGVDPETLRLEAADVGEDEPQDPASADLPDAAGSEDPESSTDPAAPLSGDEPAKEGGDNPGQDAAPSSIDLSAADLEWLKVATRMLWAATGVNEIDVLKNQMAAVRDHHTDPEISKAARARGMSIFNRCKAVCFGEAQAGDVLVEIAAIAGVETKEIV